MTRPDCNYHGCSAVSKVRRRAVWSGNLYHYCREHDPLKDDEIADTFEEP